MNELYYDTLIGIALLAVPVLWSADRYLARQLGTRHDRGLQWVLACFGLWALTSWAARDNALSGHTGGREWVMMQYIISGAVNAFFLVSMSFFRPDESTRLGRFYRRIDWKKVVGVLIGASFILFTVFRQPAVRDWLDVQISSVVIFLFTAGMAMIFAHRRLPLMAAVALVNGLLIVLVQGDQYRVLHLGEPDILPALGSGLPGPWGQVFHVVARAGLVYCLLMLALSWHGEQAGARDTTFSLPVQHPSMPANRLEFALQDNAVQIRLWLSGWPEALDLSGLPANDKERLVGYAALALDGREILHKDYSNFSRDKSELLKHINDLLDGERSIREADLFIQNSKGRSALRVDRPNIDLPKAVLEKYHYQ